jgi:hypothetical protein
MRWLARQPRCLALIMFELTDTLTYAVPVMLGVLVAKTIADALEPKGIYELVIEYAAQVVLSLLVLMIIHPGLLSFHTSTRSTNTYGAA